MCCNTKGCCGNGCKCTFSKVGNALVLIGALNWGLVGLGHLVGGELANWNVVNIIFGSMSKIEALVYVLVGAAAVMSIVGCRCKKCTAGVCDVHGVKEGTEGAGKM